MLARAYPASDTRAISMNMGVFLKWVRLVEAERNLGDGVSGDAENENLGDHVLLRRISFDGTDSESRS